MRNLYEDSSGKGGDVREVLLPRFEIIPKTWQVQQHYDTVFKNYKEVAAVIDVIVMISIGLLILVQGR